MLVYRFINDVELGVALEDYDRQTLRWYARYLITFEGMPVERGVIVLTKSAHNDQAPLTKALLAAIVSLRNDCMNASEGRHGEYEFTHTDHLLGWLRTIDPQRFDEAIVELSMPRIARNVYGQSTITAQSCLSIASNSASNDATLEAADQKSA